MIKALDGGGGRNIQVVAAEDGVEECKSLPMGLVLLTNCGRGNIAYNEGKY